MSSKTIEERVSILEQKFVRLERGQPLRSEGAADKQGSEKEQEVRFK